jgi:hypothetical protein
MLTSGCVILFLRQSSAYASTVLYNPAVTATKLAMLMLYYRMSQFRPFFRYATLVVAVIVVLNGFVLTFLIVFQCRPISGAFKEQEPRAPTSSPSSFAQLLSMSSPTLPSWSSHSPW